MKVTIKKKHFDAATGAPWSSGSCLLWQAANEYGLGYAGVITSLAIADRNEEAMKMRDYFDRSYVWATEYSDTALVEEGEFGLANLRAALPITFEI